MERFYWEVEVIYWVLVVSLSTTGGKKWHRHYQCPGKHLKGLEGLMFCVQGI